MLDVKAADAFGAKSNVEMQLDSFRGPGAKDRVLRLRPLRRPTPKGGDYGGLRPVFSSAW